VNHRPLKKIAAEIATILKRQAKDVIEIGRLLTEAREQLDEHAQWLLWLTDNFSLSIRTAQRYLTAHAFASKYDTVSHLSLTVSGLYALIEADRAGRSEAVEAALSEAKVQWVDDDRVREIVAALRPPPPEEPPSDEASDEAPPPDAAKDGAQPPDEAATVVNPATSCATEQVRDRHQRASGIVGPIGARISRRFHVGFRFGDPRRFPATGRQGKGKAESRRQ
jgi:hypothetical protein